MHDVKKVYVIHKTHLDIGFTGFAQDVLDRYVKEFIPQAIETAYSGWNRQSGTVILCGTRCPVQRIQRR